MYIYIALHWKDNELNMEPSDSDLHVTLHLLAVMKAKDKWISPSLHLSI